MNDEQNTVAKPGVCVKCGYSDWGAKYLGAIPGCEGPCAFPVVPATEVEKEMELIDCPMCGGCGMVASDDPDIARLASTNQPGNEGTDPAGEDEDPVNQSQTLAVESSGLLKTSELECCVDWEPETRRLNAPLVLAQAWNPHLTSTPEFQFKTWTYCPWCGRNRKEFIEYATQKAAELFHKRTGMLPVNYEVQPDGTWRPVQPTESSASAAIANDPPASSGLHSPVSKGNEGK